MDGKIDPGRERPARGIMDGKARIAEARRIRPDIVRPCLEWNPNFRRTADSHLCACCHEKIAGWVEDERFTEIRRFGDRAVVVKRMIVGAFAAYREGTLEFDDGSAHSLGLCASCCEKLKEATAEELESVYAATLQDMADIEEKGGGKAPWKNLLDRRPVRLAKVEG